ncbi:MAG: hypothetical protein ABJM29_08795 [Rhizobiaceae bacterium]
MFAAKLAKPISTALRMSVVVALSLMPVSLPAYAQEDLGTLDDLLPPSPGAWKKRSMTGRVQLFDNILLYPLPVWSNVANGAAPAERSKIRTANRDGLYQMSMVPHDEEFTGWENLFTVTAHQKDPRPVMQQGHLVMQQFQAVCSPSNMQVFKVHASPTTLVQVIACGNYSRDRSKGQMAAVVTRRNQSGLVTMTRQWRTAPFQSKIQSNWPIPKSELDGVLRELSRSKLIPSKKKQG